MEFTADQLKELESRGLTAADVAIQIHRFTKEILPIKLERPCIPGDGIHVLPASECHRYLSIYENDRQPYSIAKFVPASGAASRMFKHLYNYSPEMVSDLTEEFILQFERFPFVDTLRKKLALNGIDLNVWKKENNWEAIFKSILYFEGLNYSNFPKGLVEFHHHHHRNITAFEEHIIEAIQYAKDKNGKCHLHFTLAPAHIDLVLNFIEKQIEHYYPYEDIVVTHSVQSEKSDTIALDENNQPALNAQGQFIFRPAGHGALIHNLQSIDSDIIFIKNIDNVTTSAQLEDTVFFKKVIGGLLISLKKQAEKIIEGLHQNEDHALENGLEFLQNWFQSGLPIGLSKDQLSRYVQLRLDRPLRICGMVRNEGEPGGGPFWVRLSDGSLSKQIVEKSQVDTADHHQLKILSEATHFNPVDIVCSIKNSKGVAYSLVDFVDHSTGFVSEKFQDGKVIKALELPGLWNGSMALWNTVFVEVPVSTFNPVKTVNDLLRAGHQIA